VLPVGDAGGAQTVVAALAVGLASAGVSSHVAGIIGDRAGHPWLERLAEAGVGVHVVRARARRYADEVAQVGAIAGRIGAVVVHSHAYRADYVTWRAHRGQWAHAVTAHGFTGGGWRDRVYESIGRWLMTRADATIAVSHPLAALLRSAGVPAARLHVLPNVLGPVAAADRRAARAALGLSDTDRVVGFIGRLGREKGADQLLAAVPQLPLGTRVVLVGDGPERGALEAQAASRPPSQVTFAGTVTDAGRLVRAFDVICLPSRTEGTPMVLLEALAAGVPAVAFGVGGIPDVLAAAPEWLVPPGDTAALARGLTAVLTAPEASAVQARSLGSLRAARHNPAAWIAAHRRIYTTIAGLSV
jgi:glycosyltransferase involved in cell wall biosynthesis